MEVKQINQLMVAMGRYGMKRISIKRDGIEIEIERESKAPIIDSFQEFPNQIEPAFRAGFDGHKSFDAIQKESRGSRIVENVSNVDEKNFLFVTSPMVGTIYLSASPQESSFVKVGDTIDENSVVCIVEAMKVMNEVKAGVRGVVQEILVDNAHPVEFGTKLIRVIPQS